MWRLGLWCLVCAGFAEAQVITTVAGTTKVFPTAGIRAVNAQLGVRNVAVDGSGNIYIADPSDNIVARVQPDGTLAIVAGNGLAGFSGDGGPATKASLNVPLGVAVDSAGNVYIADQFNERIRKVSGGTITTVAGGGSFGSLGDGGPATNATLSIPEGIAVDLAGNLYIADTGNHRIRKVSGGTITTLAGNGNEGFSGDGGPATIAELYFPQSVAVDSGGNVFVADTINERIRRVSNGTITTVAGSANFPPLGDGGPATSAGLSIPEGVAVDSAGNLYIADTGNYRVRKVSGGTITTVAGNGIAGFSGDGAAATNASLGGATVPPSGPSGVAVDSAGSLYIADAYNNRVRQVSSGTITTIAGNGLLSFSGDGGSATSALLDSPNGLALDSNGSLYIADGANHRIRKISGGVITTIAGDGNAGFSGDGGSAVNASLNFPGGIAIDSAGNLYFADVGNNRIRKISGGTISTVAGNGSFAFFGDGGPATNASLFAPGGLAVDSAGSLYIADTGNNRIRKVSGGTITTVAGNGNEGFSGDGGSASSASLAFPADVAVDSAGNLYIADTINGIRKVSGGTITTLVGGGKQLFYPVGVALDATGNLYVTDQVANRVLKVAGETVTTAAGNGNRGFSGDGGLATNASLSMAEGLLTGYSGLAVDSLGSLYIADSGNNRIRQVLAGAASAPAIDPNRAALNSASFNPGAVAPGSLVSIFGTNFASGNALADSIPLPISLANVSVTFNDIAAPLSGVFHDAVNGDQINVQVPWAVSTPATAQVVVTRSGVASPVQLVSIAAASPGIFAIQLSGGQVVGSGVGQAIAYGNSDGIIAAPVGAITGLATHPARINDPATLVILATGLGPVDTTVRNGDVPSVITSNTLTTPTVMIGDVRAQVVFSGMVGRDASGKALGFVGVYQINVIVAPGTPTGNAVKLQVSSNGVTSRPDVTIAVSQ